MRTKHPKKTNRELRSPADPSLNSPGSPVTPDELDFWVRIRAITPEEWAQGMKTYVYLVWPIIDRKEGEHYIAKLSEGFDEDFLLRTFGSGKFYLRLNDRSGHTIASKTVSCYNAKLPPKVNAEEVVVGDPRNERYFSAWPKSSDRDRDSDAGGKGDQAAVLAAVNKFAEITKQLLDHKGALQEDQRTMLRAAHDESLRLVTEQARSDAQPVDALGMLEKILTVTDKLHPAPPPVATAPDPLAMLDKVLKIAKELHPAPEAPEEKQNQVEQLSSLLDVIEKLEGRLGKGAGDSGDGPANWKIALAQSLGGKIDTILERVEKTVGNYARAQEHRAAVMLAGRGFEVRTTPEPAAAGTPQTSATPSATAGEAPSPEPAAAPPVLSTGDFIKSKLVEMLFAGKEGDNGAIFAEAVDTDFAEQIAKTMKENPSALATDNILAQATRHPNAQKFCEAYVGYFEGEEEPAPEAAAEGSG